MTFAAEHRAVHPSGVDLAEAVRQRFGLVVHPRSLERALAQPKVTSRLGTVKLVGLKPQLTEAYEIIRVWAKGECDQRPPGAALILRRGLAEWIMEASSWLPAEMPEPSKTITPVAMSNEVVVVLSNMLVSVVEVMV